MDCREFDRVWNDWLDARDDRVADRELAREMPEAREHARRCAACGRAELGYEALLRALAAWGRDGRAWAGTPPELADRVLAALSSPSPSSRSRPGRRPGFGLALGFAAAAAAAVLALVLAPARRRDEPARPSAPFRGPDSHILEDSLAQAAAATLDLARSASEPAARLGRGAIEAATRAEEITGQEAPETLTSMLRGPIDLAPLPTLLPEIGERVSAGVRPLSSTARRAFDFLRSPSFEPNGRRISSPTSKGA
jgi:hypothetical protein